VLVWSRNTLHRFVRRNFQRRRTVVSDIGDQWQADLIDLTTSKKFNNGHTFVLIVEIFAWAELLKNKTSKSVLKAFAKVLNRSGRKSLFLYTDRGLEFDNKLFQRWLKKKQIHFLTPQNQETKAAIAEGMIRTFLFRIWRYFTFKGYQKIRRRSSRLFTILRSIISSQHKTKQSPIPVAKSSRGCAANRLSISNGVVQLTSRYKQICLQPVIFFATQVLLCSRVVCFLKVFKKAVVISR